MTALHGFVFGVYPYICLTVFLLGSLIRFDRDQYTWKSDSSQLLRGGLLRWGSNLFHIGILFLFFGHLMGLLTPHAFYAHFMEASVKQQIAIWSGGAFGVLCFIGLTMLIWRRVFDPRIRRTSHRTDIAILVILWVQLVVGLITLPYSWAHSDGSVMLILADWAQRIMTLRPVDAAALADVAPSRVTCTSCCFVGMSLPCQAPARGSRGVLCPGGTFKRRLRTTWYGRSR
jgi:nitrate reductase gamma subunit